MPRPKSRAMSGPFAAFIVSCLLAVAPVLPLAPAAASEATQAVAEAAAPTPAAATPGVWSATGSLAHARGFAPAILLGDGTVITAGGTDGATFTATAERWTSGTWSSAGAIGQAVAGQVAALLPNGKALFAGGADAMSYYMHGDLFDPGTGNWTQTQAMTHGHAYGAAASLSNGNVIVIGGYDGGPTLTTGAVDIYSAAGGTWSSGAPMPGPRYAFTATSLNDGRVLVAGGDDGSMSAGSALSSVEIYNAGSWSAAESMKKVRLDQAAVLLKDGRVLVAGGIDASGAALNTAEIYNPATGHWTNTALMTYARAGFTLTVLPDGRVLAAGGYSSPSSALTTADLFDPTTGGWTATGSLATGRRYQAATPLADGSVMVVGGHGTGTSYLASAEVFTPPPARTTYPSTTFHPVDPARILDSRVGTGLSGAFYNRVPRRFQVTGKGGVPAEAIAVTGILTTTQSTAGGYLTLGPVFTGSPSSSTLNFPKGDNRANNVAVALDETGMLSLVYVGTGHTQAIFDVTGYFTADTTGATFFPVDPVRLLDSRNGTGLTGKFATRVTRPFAVAGVGGVVPADALAVTGNLTVVNSTSKGWALLAPSIPADPVTANCSTVNTTIGDIRADGVTVKLAADGTLSAVWVGTAGSSADLVFDVTGYYLAGTSGSLFVPLEPTRLVDTRLSLPFMGPIHRATPVTVQVAGMAGVPASATGVSGNLTVTAQTYLGYMTVAPHLDPGVIPNFSTVNFPVGDNRANGFFVRLNTDGTLAFVYEASRSTATTHFVLDVTGYFVPAS